MTIKENPYACSVCYKPIQYTSVLDNNYSIHVHYAEGTIVYKNKDGNFIYTCPMCVRFNKIKRIKSRINGKKLFRLFVR